MKIRVMVVEDEPPIQRSICQKIEEIGGNFQVVATADNGKDACEYLQENTVDVLFVDMNLPIMDGQEVLSVVAEQKKKLIPVVLSGYKDFAYVKSALENNAFDYLLKPLKDSELKQLLKKIEEKLRRQQFEESAQKLEEALTGGLAEDKEKAAQTGQKYCMLLLTFGNNLGSLEECGRNYQEVYYGLPLEEHLSRAVLWESFWVVDGKNENEKLIFIRKGREPEINNLRAVLKELKCAPLPLTAVYHREAVELSEILSVYRSMQKYTREHKIFMKDALLVYSPGNISRESADRRKELDCLLAQCGNAGADRLSEAFGKLLELLTARPVLYKEAVHDVKYFVFRLCQKYPGHREYYELEQEVQFILDNYYTQEAIRKEFDFLFRDVFGKAPVETDDKANLAEKMKHYLDENFRSNITNQFLAERFGFVGSYLSSIFKTYYGVTPIDYVVKKRMEEGKELLEKGEMKIKEVADWLGYQDSLYFSKVFKRVTGMSPREYVGKGTGKSRKIF
ncbi:MAG: response regulator [Lachnospiraceae bacterium]|nr:response regulator [Lachnospiraceae bacterium]